MTLPTREFQELNQGSALIYLYKIDLTMLGGGAEFATPFYVTNNALPSGGNPSYGGQTYLAFPIEGKGFDYILNGNQPKPTISVSDVGDGLLFSAVIKLEDAIGGEVTRYVTYAKYLDGGATPDASRHGKQLYLIDQKTEHIPGKSITWALSTLSDRMGFYLPRRQYLQDRGFPGFGMFRS